jgi:hypothetical protein
MSVRDATRERVEYRSTGGFNVAMPLRSPIGESQEVLSFCRTTLQQFERQLRACCLGSLTELYDADPPDGPGGCPAQL